MSQQGFRELLGLRSGGAEDGGASVLLDAQERHVNPVGTIHGGVVATLLDVAMAEALSTVIPGRGSPVTVEMKLNFLQPARVGVLVANARVRRRGRRLAVVHGEVVQDGNDELVAEGMGTFAATHDPG